MPIRQCPLCGYATVRETRNGLAGWYCDRCGESVHTGAELQARHSEEPGWITVGTTVKTFTQGSNGAIDEIEWLLQAVKAHADPRVKELAAECQVALDILDYVRGELLDQAYICDGNSTTTCPCDDPHCWRKTQIHEAVTI